MDIQATAFTLDKPISLSYLVEMPSNSDMIQIPLRFSEPAMLWLREEAAHLGISIADLVRRIVDEKRGADARKGSR